MSRLPLKISLPVAMSSSSSTNGEDANAPVATKTLLHGRLEFYIDRAEGLPDTDHFPLTLRFADAFGTNYI